MKDVPAFERFAGGGLIRTSSYTHTVPVVLFLAFLWLFGGTTLASAKPALELIYPAEKKLSMTSPTAYLVGLVDSTKVAVVEVSIPVVRREVLTVNPRSYREDFALLIRDLFTSYFRISSLEVTVEKAGRDIKTKTWREEFKREEEQELEGFWNSSRFERLYQRALQDSLATRINISVEGRRVIRYEMNDPSHHLRFGNVFVFRIGLNQGNNVLEVSSYDKSGVMVGGVEVEAFYHSRLDKATRVPKEYVSATFHDQSGSDLCAECHEMNPGEEEKVGRGAIARSCYPCHTAITEEMYVHGPTAVWSCFYCHREDSTVGGGYIFRGEGAEKEVCFECHNGILQTLNNDRIVHGPVAGGTCTLCHSPHGSSQPYMLLNPVVDQCVSCHDKRYLMNHPVPGHPVQGQTDPLDPDRPFTCVSCHSPHSSNNESLFYRATGTFKLCSECHPQ